MATLKQLQGKQISYNETNKAQFHRAATKALKSLATKLDLTKENHEVRSNKGGIAVSGEVTLHSDNIYIQISESFNGKGLQVLFRTCNGRKDYSGGQNNYAPIERLEDPEFVSQLKKMQKTN